MNKILQGNVITPTAVLPSHRVLISCEKIIKIQPSEAPLPEAFQGEEIPLYDAREGWIAPGFIDIHSDYIEHMAAPRPTSLMDFQISLHEAERELIGHGITTMYHSLSFYAFWKFDEKVIRNPENTQKFIELIHKTGGEKHLIHHRFHARFEIDSLDRVEELEGYIHDKKIHLLSFMDHTPGQGQYRDLEMYRKTLKGYRNISDAEVDQIIHKGQTTEKLPITAIQELTKAAKEQGIVVASHDDDTIEKLRLNRELGLDISEFPITMEVAKEARAMGFHTVAGAPNVMLGGSHSGNLSAAEAVLAGAVDTLCSDYYPASMLHAPFILHERMAQSLPEAFQLVSLNPAKAVGIDNITGSIEEGKQGDILFIHKLPNGLPAITKAFVAGHQSFTTSYREDL